MSEVLAEYNELIDESKLITVVFTKPFEKRPVVDNFDTLIKPATKLRLPGSTPEERAGTGIGIMTGIRDGRDCGVLVLDFDIDEPTTEEYELNEALMLAFPKRFPELEFTSQEKTPSGGAHFFLEVYNNMHIPTRGASKKITVTTPSGVHILPMDVRCDKGFCVTYPSPYAGSDKKKWKNDLKGNPYEQVIPLRASNVNKISPELYDALLNKKSFIFTKYDVENADYEIDIAPDVDFTIRPDDDIDDLPVTSTDDSTEDGEYYGWVRNVDCFKEVLSQLNGNNLNLRDDWIRTMWTLIHVFGTPFGGEVDKAEFGTYFNDRCKLFKGYDKMGNLEKIDEEWTNVKPKMLKYGALKQMLVDNFGGKDVGLTTYNKFLHEMRDKNLYIFKKRETGDIRDFGDIAEIGKDTSREDSIKFIHANIRFIIDRGNNAYYTRNLIRGIRPLPGMKIISDEELERYYEWTPVLPAKLYETLDLYKIGEKKLTPKGKESVMRVSLADLIKDSDVRRPITYKVAKFSPRALGKENELVGIPRAFGEFSYAPDFRARVKYTREEALKNEGCQLLLNHVRKVLANDNEDSFKYLLGVQAHMFQKPDEKTQVMCIFKDEYRGGSGKSLFANLLGYGLAGALFQQYSTLDEYQAKFETDKADKCLIWIDELADNGVINKAHLKNAITGTDSSVQGKGLAIRRAANYNCIWAATNEATPIPIDPGQERRYAVFEVSKEVNQEDYFEKLLNITQDGLDAYFSYLMSIDIPKETNFVVGKGFTTPATISQQARSICSVDKLFIDYITGDFTSKSVQCETKAESLEFLNKALYEEYVRHTQESGQHPVKVGKLTESLKSFGEASKITVGKARANGYRLQKDAIVTVMRKRLGDKLYDYLTKLAAEEPERVTNPFADLDEEFASDNGCI